MTVSYDSDRKLYLVNHNESDAKKTEMYRWLDDHCPDWNFSWRVITLGKDVLPETETAFRLMWLAYDHSKET